MSMGIDEVSAKIRTGGPLDIEDDYGADCWAGTIPISQRLGARAPDATAPPHTDPEPEIGHFAEGAALRPGAARGRAQGGFVMEKSPPPLSLAAALALPLARGRASAEVFVDGDLEIRLYAPKGHDPQTPHDRDELYVVASGWGKFRVGDRVDPFAPGALLYAAAHETHRFEDFSADFAVWVVFYGPVK